VSHLNAVLNSDALRSAYNACLPLLSAYQTDLAQSEPLFRAYRTIADQEGAALAPVQRQVIEHAMRDFRLAGVGLPAQRKERFKSVMLELTQLQAKSKRTCWMPPTPGRATSRIRSSCAD